MIEPILIISGIIVSILAMLLVNTFHIKIFGFTLSFTRQSIDFNQIRNLILNYYKEQDLLEHTIIKNQMSHAEGVLIKITDKILSNGYTNKYNALISQELAHSYIKQSMLANGFGDLSSSELITYIQNKISAIRKLYITNLEEVNEYVDSHEFSELISDIYSHAASCYAHWKSRQLEAEERFNIRFGQMIK